MSDEPKRRIRWPVVVVGALALLGAFTLIQWVLGTVFTLARLAILGVIVVAVILFFRGPPDGER